jgi:hypothetical protein
MNELLHPYRWISTEQRSMCIDVIEKPRPYPGYQVAEAVKDDGNNDYRKKGVNKVRKPSLFQPHKRQPRQSRVQAGNTGHEPPHEGRDRLNTTATTESSAKEKSRSTGLSGLRMKTYTIPHAKMQD